MKQRIGIGYDIHRLTQGRRLILGGVDIPHDRGLDGHSDADVLIHAVCDALLGALGRGDIGEHFSDSDERFRNVSSLILLEKVHAMVEGDGYQINNVDCIIQAEEPNLKQYKAQMRSHIAYKLKIETERVNIKATTHEQLGSIGKKEGIAAFASVLLTSRQ
jgi:2-C-methyl-D-erythritol 2,4-cyclodiphosphate synthase